MLWTGLYIAYSVLLIKRFTIDSLSDKEGEENFKYIGLLDYDKR